jgi:hypothetical protein
MLRTLHLPGNTPTLLLALICSVAIYGITEVTKDKYLRLSCVGATSATTSATALQSLLLCMCNITSERPCLTWQFNCTCNGARCVPVGSRSLSLRNDGTSWCFLLDPESICTATPQDLPSCILIVSDVVECHGHAVCTVPLLADCVPPVPSAAVRGRCCMSRY